MSLEYKTIDCIECDATFSIEFDENKIGLAPIFCPFCGNDLEEEDSWDSDSEEEDEDFQA